MIRFLHLLGLLVVCCALRLSAQNTLFNASFTGDLINPVAPDIYPTPTSSTTGWVTLSNKNLPASNESGKVLNLNMVSTTSGYFEAQARFAASATELLPGTYLEVTLTFTPTAILDGSGDSLMFGLFNSGGVAPLTGLAVSGLNASTSPALYGTGGAKGWIGYNALIPFTGASTRMYTRPAQTGSVNTVQDLLIGNQNTGNGYNFTAGATATSLSSMSTTLTSGTTYTLNYRLSLNAAGTSLVANVALYGGSSATGTPLGSYSGTFTGANLLTKAFDAFAIGWRATGTPASTSSMAISSFAVRTTGGIPWITSQPVDKITISVDDDLYLLASVGGTVDSYQWQYSPDGLVFSNLNTTDIPSAATASLTLSKVQASNAGVYRVLATNSLGTVTSSNSVVTVTSSPVPPSILINPVGSTILGGTSYSFSAKVNGTSPFTFQWQRSSDGIAYTDIAGATGLSYSIASASILDEGYYQIVVTNEAGTITSTPVQLIVNQPLTILTQPVGATLNPGDTYTLSTLAVGKPAPTYQWYLNGTALSGATSASYVITAAAAANAGLYTVVASNTTGDKVTSSVAAVAVVNSALTTTAQTPVTTPAGVAPDTRLTLTFNQPVSAGVMGTIKIYDAASPVTPVDTIDLIAANALMKSLRAVSTTSTQALPVQNKTIGGLTNFNYYPLTISGNTVTIYPRNGVLSYGHTYYVTIDAGVFVDSTGLSFPGLSGSSAWNFRIRPDAPSSTATQLVVAADGSGDFCTVQGALDFIPAANTTARTIFIKKGTYFEQVYFYAKHNLTFLGESRTESVIAYPNNNNFNNVGGSYHRMTMQADKANNVVMANLTVRNTTPKGGSQAEALILNGNATAKAIVTGVDLYSYQDTLLSGQAYYSDCHISGDVDYMWGGGVCFFNNCQLTTLSSGAYLTQIRNGSTGHGNVYLNCTLDAPAGVTNVYLSRIDPTSGGYPYSEVVWINCVMGSVSGSTYTTPIAPAGWLLNGTTDQTAASAPNLRFYEYNSHYSDGTPLNVASRIGASKQLTLANDAETIANYSNPTWVFGGTWTPALSPLIAVQPVAQSSASGASVTLSVTAVGVPSLSYQWLRNGVVIPGATGSSYTIPAVSAADAGLYSVVVTSGSASVTTTAVPLVVDGAAPVIALQPVATSGLLGTTATFSVWAQGNAPLSYQWFKDGSPLDGATRQSLRITGLKASDAGNYSVSVSNANGAILSDSVALTLVTPATTVPTLPSIPAQFFDVTAFGAVGDSATDNTVAIQAAINAARTAGGGTVEFPAASGAYLTGPITVYAKINIQLNTGAILRALPFGTYPKSYTAPAHFITIYSASTDVEFSGGGTIDGQGKPWWAAYDLGVISNRPRLMQINKTRNMLFTGIKILNSPNFNMAFSGACANVTIFGVSIYAPADSSNTDGIDVTGQNYLIQNCSVSVGDDNIVAKPGSEYCSNLYIADCFIGTGHGVSIGGQTNAGLDGMTVTGCSFDGTSSAIRMKADPTQGGPVKNVTYSNLTMKNVTYPILFYSYYNILGSPGATSGSSQITPAKVVAHNVTPPNSLASTTIPTWKNITVSNVTITAASGYSTIWGLPTADGLIQNVVFNNVMISGGAGLELYNATNVQFTGVNSLGSYVTANALAITGQPTSLSASVGGSATFKVTAVGTSGVNSTAPTYQWYLNGTALADGTQEDGSSLAGSTTATLVVSNVVAGRAGSYTCKVSNKLDGYNTATSTLVPDSLPVSATSSAATLTVEIPDLFAYALGVPANGLWSSAAPALGRTDGQTSLSFERVRGDASYLVQRSSDLVTWTDVALNPGSVGSRVTVVDPASLGATRSFLRVRVTAAGKTATWVPEGQVLVKLPAGASTTYTGHPFDIPAIYHGVVSSVSGAVVTVDGAPFNAGALVSTPCWLRVMSGAQAGRHALITANTASSLTVDLADGTASSVALDVSGWALAAGDVIEVAPADTLASFFGDLLTGGSSILTSDTVSFWEGTRWVAYYYSTTTKTWLGQLTGTTSQSTRVIRPDEAFSITRRAGRPALSLVLGGAVPIHAQLLRHPGAASRVTPLRFPVPQSLSGFAFSGPGAWVSADGILSADTVGRWSGTAWLSYWRTSSGAWLQQGDGTLTDKGSLQVQPGEALNVLRRSSATGAASFLSQPLPYSDPRL